MKSGPGLLCIFPNSLAEVKKKGVEEQLLQSGVDFFERVLIAHPYTDHEYSEHLDAVHEIVEFKTPNAVHAGLPRPFGALVLIWHILRTATRLAMRAKAEGLKVVRASDPYWCGLMGLITSKIAGIPLVISLHSDYDHRYELDGNRGAPEILGSRKLALKLESFLLKQADRVFPIRETLANQAISKGAHANRIRLFSHGIDLAPYTQPIENKLRKRLNIDSWAAVVSFVGRLSKENYIDDVVAFAEQLTDAKENCIVVIAGGGVEEKRLKERFKRNGTLDRQIIMPGFITAEEVVELRRTSSVNLCPMGGFSLIEACAGGAPVLAYDVEWHHELIENNITGFLLEEGDVEAMVAKAVTLIDAPEISQQIGANAKARAFAKHELSSNLNMKKGFYRELLDKTLA